MGNEETETWIKNKLIESSNKQTKILCTLEEGDKRMCTMESNLNTVMDATSEFPAFKIDVEMLKQVEADKKAKHVIDLEKQLAQKEEEAKASKIKWSDRAYDLAVKAFPYLCIAGMYIYTQIS